MGGGVSAAGVFSVESVTAVAGSAVAVVADVLLLWLWVNTDFIFRRFIQSRRVLAGMLCFMDDRLMLFAGGERERKRDFYN